MHALILGLHVVAGATALVAGPLALISPSGGHRRHVLAAAYQVGIAVLVTTAFGLVALDIRRLWWLLPVAVATEALAVGGWWQVQRRPAGQPCAWQVRLLGASYVSLVTASVVVSVGGVLAWVVPSALGAIIVEIAAARLPEMARFSAAVPTEGSNDAVGSGAARG